MHSTFHFANVHIHPGNEIYFAAPKRKRQGRAAQGGGLSIIGNDIQCEQEKGII